MSDSVIFNFMFKPILTSMVKDIQSCSSLDEITADFLSTCFIKHMKTHASENANENCTPKVDSKDTKDKIIKQAKEGKEKEKKPVKKQSTSSSTSEASEVADGEKPKFYKNQPCDYSDCTTKCAKIRPIEGHVYCSKHHIVMTKKLGIKGEVPELSFDKEKKKVEKKKEEKKVEEEVSDSSSESSNEQETSYKKGCTCCFKDCDKKVGKIRVLEDGKVYCATHHKQMEKKFNSKDTAKDTAKDTSKKTTKDTTKDTKVNAGDSFDFVNEKPRNMEDDFWSVVPYTSSTLSNLYYNSNTNIIIQLLQEEEQEYVSLYGLKKGDSVILEKDLDIAIKSWAQNCGITVTI